MSIRLLWVFILLSIPAFSQQSAIYTDPESAYHLGLDLYSKQKYVTSQQEFKRILSTKDGISREVRGNASYYIAVCAAELFHKDAEYLLLSFVNEYPENPNYYAAQYDLGNYYFRQKKYKKAVEWFAKIEKNELTTARRDELNFKLGYSYYMTIEYDAASKAFAEMKDGNSKYASAAQYYYAHMAYVNGNYETALKGFLKLKESEAFAPVVPYYITQIYYKQGKYDELLSFAPAALDSADARNGMEIGRMVAESYYRKGNYKEALPYLIDYERNSPNVGREDFYQIGICHYRTGMFEKAIPYFQKAVGTEDIISQNAYFHLAACYIKTNAKRSARTAFQSAAKMTFDKVIQEEAQFNYAKLSYELSYQSVAIEAFRSFVKDFPSSAHIDEANEMLVGMFTNTHNYKDALTSIEAIKVKTPMIKAAYQKVAYYRGIEFFMDNKPADAIKLFNLSLMNPVDQKLVAEASYWKGEAYYRLNDYDKAVKAYNEFLFTPAAITLPRYNLANYNIGYAYFKKEDYANAQTAFRKYIRDKSATDTKRFNDALLRIGDSFFMMKDQANASEYYSQAISANASSSDYAIYQRAVILGVQGRMQEKVRTLQTLFDKYPKSVYFDDGMYEAGQASLMLGNYEQALNYYRTIIKDFPNGSYMKKAELGEALVYYNTKQDDKALAAYKNIVKKYPNTNESREALAQIKNISVSQNRVDDFVKFSKTVPNADVTVAGEDSLTYDAAELLYTQGNCESAIRDFESYLLKFPQGIFSVNASYYRSDCLFRSKKYEQALEGFEAVIKAPRNQFTEKSLLNAGFINFRTKNYQKALAQYEALESIAEVKDHILSAQAGQMRCYYRMENYEMTLSASKKILESSASDKDLINEARLLSGLSYLQRNDLGSAKADLLIVSKRTNSEMTAQSKYYLALIEYKQANYKESQKLIFEIQKQVPSYDYWIAKGFILLGDNYLAQRDTFQAKETYISIVDNYEKDPTDPDDLKEIARQKLQNLNSAIENRNKEILDEKIRQAPKEQDEN